MFVPAERGPISAIVTGRLHAHEHVGAHTVANVKAYIAGTDPLIDGDQQIALFMLYELFYRGFDCVDPDLQWDPELTSLRRVLEAELEARLRESVPQDDLKAAADLTPAALPELMFGIAARESGPSVSMYLARKATLEEFREFATHRSVYHFKEADPYSLVIPYLPAKVKAAFVEVQYDEYGAGRSERMHSELYRQTLGGLGLGNRYGDHIESLPAISLAAANVTSMFGLSRRLRAAAMGHFATLEMTSSIPNRLYGNGLRRLGFGPETTLFYDEHVEADAIHEQLMVRSVCAELAAAEPSFITDIVFGELCYLMIEDLVAAHLLQAWEAGETSLRVRPAGNPFALDTPGFQGLKVRA